MVIKNNTRPLSVVFGENVKRLRILSGMTQEELAAKMGLSVSTVKYIERGRGAKLVTVELFAVMFGVNFMYLLEEVPEEEKTDG
jgi:transcriptional regulator with XRE-family HTH domain